MKPHVVDVVKALVFNPCFSQFNVSSVEVHGIVYGVETVDILSLA